MSEVGAEHTHVVAAAISHAEHSFRRDLVGYTNAGREGRPVVIDVPAQVIRTEATHANDAFLDIGKSTFRSEEHTSELQSQSNLVCRLLLEKKNNDHDCT